MAIECDETFLQGLLEEGCVVLQKIKDKLLKRTVWLVSYSDLRDVTAVVINKDWADGKMSYIRR